MKKVYLVIALFALIGVFGSLSSVTSQTAPAKPKLNVAIFIFDGVQIIDYTGPWEVFGRRFNVFTVAEKKDPITTIYGMKVIPDYDFENHPKPDILVIPGGGNAQTNPGMSGPYAHALAVRDDPKIMKWVQENAAKAQYVLSVCNGAFTLARAGLLDGLSATTTMSMLDVLKEAAPKVHVVYDQRWVDNGKIITSGGVSAGIDASLHVVEKFLGRGDTQLLALGMEYNWDVDGSFAPAMMAVNYMRFLFDIEGDSLNRQGDRDSWENKWLVTKPESAAEVFAAVNDALSQNKTWGGPTKVKWERQENAGAKGGLKSYWRFTDEQGRAWTGVASVEPASADKKGFLMTVKIARRDSAKSSMIK